MAVTFPRVSAGDPLRITAETWNALMGLGQQLRAGDAGTHPAGNNGGQLPPGVAWMFNDSGEDRNEFEILGIDEVLVKPENGLAEFLYSTPTFVGKTPSWSEDNPDNWTHHVGRWAVLLEPIACGKIGKVRWHGVVPVTLEVITEFDQRAEILDGDGDATKLRSGALGSARILWKESGTGDKRALVSFGDGPIGREHGVLDEALGEAGATVSRYYFHGGWRDTEHDDYVYPPPEASRAAIPSGKRVWYEWSHAARRLEVLGREC